MKTKIYFLLITAALGLFSCGTTNTKIIGSWKSDELKTQNKYKSLFIAALTENKQAQDMLENELAYKAERYGITAHQSNDVFIKTFTKNNLPNKQELLKEINTTKSDLIFTIALQDKETETRYVPGTTSYMPMGFGPYYGNFYGYYSYMYPTVYEPGYYTTDKIYYLESNLYDAKTEKLLWSAQSATCNPADLEDFTKGYTNALVKQLIKDGLVQKQD